MDNIFTLGDNDGEGGTLDIDELYARKQEADSKKLNTYNKILGRVHNKVKLTSRHKKDEQYCWYIVPEILVGVTHYDHVECIKFLIAQLRENGFDVTYTHPNLLLISWVNWVPAYVRQEIKRQTGQKVDSTGRIVPPKNGGAGGNNRITGGSGSMRGNNNEESFEDINLQITNLEDTNTGPVVPKYRDVKSYTPSGKSIYSIDGPSKSAK
jgi:hypothetical protein